MFAYILNNTFQYFIPQGTAFEIDGIQYPANWLNLSTPEEKAAVGIVDVVYGVYPNDQYYWVSQDAPIYANGVVTVNYTATPKDFATTQSDAIASINSQAYSILAPSDWMVTKAFETSTAIPEAWNTWRASIRTTANNTRDAVSACTDVAGVEAVMSNIVWPNDPNWVAVA
jgi:hypothetical protein